MGGAIDAIRLLLCMSYFPRPPASHFFIFITFVHACFPCRTIRPFLFPGTLIAIGSRRLT